MCVSFSADASGCSANQQVACRAVQDGKDDFPGCAGAQQCVERELQHLPGEVELGEEEAAKTIQLVARIAGSGP